MPYNRNRRRISTIQRAPWQRQRNQPQQVVVQQQAPQAPIQQQAQQQPQAPPMPMSRTDVLRQMGAMRHAQRMSDTMAQESARRRMGADRQQLQQEFRRARAEAGQGAPLPQHLLERREQMNQAISRGMTAGELGAMRTQRQQELDMGAAQIRSAQMAPALRALEAVSPAMGQIGAARAEARGRVGAAEAQAGALRHQADQTLAGEQVRADVDRFGIETQRDIDMRGHDVTQRGQDLRMRMAELEHEWNMAATDAERERIRRESENIQRQIQSQERMHEQTTGIDARRVAMEERDQLAALGREPFPEMDAPPMEAGLMDRRTGGIAQVDEEFSFFPRWQGGRFQSPAAFGYRLESPQIPFWESLWRDRREE